MDDKATEQPLVTFALFAYNQEDYIREAIDGAFSQTYEPLEIILSDDCSGDRTFKIIEEMAATYDGPHKVSVRRNEFNHGLAEHINTVIEVISGDIVIAAAGDDISLPCRVEKIVNEFTKCEDIYAVFSGYRPLENSIVGEKHDAKKREGISLIEILIAGGGIGKGATYAYRKSCFSWPQRLPSELTQEDRLLPLRAALLGAVEHIGDALIQYRQEAVTDEQHYQKSRMKSKNLKSHWRLLRGEIRSAKEEGRISLGCVLLLMALSRYSEFFHSVKWPKKIPLLRSIFFLPLRTALKIPCAARPRASDRSSFLGDGDEKL